MKSKFLFFAFILIFSNCKSVVDDELSIEQNANRSSKVLLKATQGGEWQKPSDGLFLQTYGSFKRSLNADEERNFYGWYGFPDWSELRILENLSGECNFYTCPTVKDEKVTGVILATQTGAEKFTFRFLRRSDFNLSSKELVKKYGVPDAIMGALALIQYERTLSNTFSPKIAKHLKSAELQIGIHSIEKPPIRKGNRD